MSHAEGDWRAGLDEVDAALIDGYQSGVPIVERPFRAIGDDLGVSETEALSRVERLRERGIVRRFGAVLNPPVIGSSTLAALSVPDERFDAVAEVVNGYPQVNHNYRRDHEWNMWFVVTAAARETRDRILAEIEERTGLAVLNLPMLTDYYIDLEFPVVNDDRFARETRPGGASPNERAVEPRARETRPAGAVPDDGATGPRARETGGGTEVTATRISESATVDLSPLDRRVLLAIQDGFPLSATPYADVAAAAGAGIEETLAAVERLREAGCIKRIGCVINHITTGFDANCMVVWDVPDDELDDRGTRVGRLPYVTLCYHRPRRPEQGWEYNLFTMVHGREASAVDAKVDELAAEHLPFPHERLYSTETLKQTGARYEELVEAGRENVERGDGGADADERSR